MTSLVTPPVCYPPSLRAPSIDRAAQISQRAWQQHSLMTLAALKAATPQTPLRAFTLPGFAEAHVLIKDERAHASGSLKHRLAMSLFEQALVEGWLTPGRPVIEASSGSTAVSEAWLARQLGLEFIAVVPAATAPDKLAAIRAEKGQVVEVSDAARLCQHAQQLADDSGGHFINQFRHAATASDWRSVSSLPGECLRQIAVQGLPPLEAVLLGAGTGGSAATFARHLRLKGERAKVIGVDPEHSVYVDCWQHFQTHGVRQTALTPPCASNPIEGIGRPCVLEAFRPEDFDDYLPIEDSRSQAAALWLAEYAERTGQEELAVGPSTGTALAGLLQTLETRRARGESFRGSWLILACDSASRYASTFGCQTWREHHQSRLAPHMCWLERVVC